MVDNYPPSASAVIRGLSSGHEYSLPLSMNVVYLCRRRAPLGQCVGERRENCKQCSAALAHRRLRSHTTLLVV